MIAQIVVEVEFSKEGQEGEEIADELAEHLFQWLLKQPGFKVTFAPHAEILQ